MNYFLVIRQKTLLLDLDETLIHITPVVKFGDKIINIKVRNQFIQVKFNDVH